MSSEGLLVLTENEVSFTLNLFTEGYSIGRPSENESANQATLQDVPMLLHLYERTSETLFSFIKLRSCLTVNQLGLLSRAGWVMAFPFIEVASSTPLTISGS